MIFLLIALKVDMKLNKNPRKPTLPAHGYKINWAEILVGPKKSLGSVRWL